MKYNLPVIWESYLVNGILPQNASPKELADMQNCVIRFKNCGPCSIKRTSSEVFQGISDFQNQMRGRIQDLTEFEIIWK